MSLARVQERMADAAARVDRDVYEITLVAVSKGQPPESIRDLYEMGHRDFGENRAQELRSKVPELPGDVKWHFIGPLQSNKARSVRQAVIALHSMDRVGLGAAWMKGVGAPPDCYLQINIGREPQKSGVDPAEAENAAAELTRIGIPLVGVMAIPPLVSDPDKSRPYFVQLRGIRDRLRDSHPEIRGLSMGMTDDFEVAVEEGATVIRVGRAIFQD